MVQGLAARLAAGAMVHAVIEKKTPLPATHDITHPADLKPGEKLFARALASACLRHFGQINQALRQCLSRPDAKPGKGLGQIRYPLSIAAAEILFLNRPAHAAVFLAVAAIRRRHPHLAGFANAVLRRLAAGRENFTTLPAANAPTWMAQRWQRQWGKARAENLALAHALAPERPVISLKNPQEIAFYAKALKAQPLKWGSLDLAQLRLSSGEAVESLPGWRDGAWWVQSAAAAWPARFLGDVKNRAVLDFCAAPGGKAAQLAVAGAKLTAFDPDAARRQRLKTNFRRLGLKADFPEKRENLVEKFDAVLVDAPCMGTGTLRRNPDIAYIRQPGDLPRLVELQQNLLAQGADVLKPGGVMVYSVCSLEREEGEEVVDSFLAAHPEIRLDAIKPEEMGGEVSALKDGQFRIWPCHEGGRGSMDGFYAARLIRRP